MTAPNYLIYEHPLHEKVRTYLRIESGIQQVRQQADLQDEARQHAFFSSLFALLETIERNDVRPDLLKDIDKAEQALAAQGKEEPSKGPALQAELFRVSKLSGNLRDDKLLAPLRQRFLIPGGSCFFDLPQLQFWYSLPIEQRKQQIEVWLQELQLAEQAISYVLERLRCRGEFKPIKAIAGFYQSSTDQFELLRIRYDAKHGSYPTVSGNRYRYAVRFMQLSEQQGRTFSDKAIAFELACC